mmetsp:Transcript_30355/g.86898  ORF Transcript_30355/g.86898 Transcript_30355/m.86898 type:complete len:409 (+) Transcript_30355:103-1329(+)
MGRRLSSSSSSSSSTSEKSKRSGKKASRSSCTRNPEKASCVVVLDSDSSPERPNNSGTRKHATKAKKRSRSRRRSHSHKKARARLRKQSRSGSRKCSSSRSRKRSRSRRRRTSRGRSKPRRRSLSGGDHRRPCRSRSLNGSAWSRGRGSEPPLPSYALAYIPKAALDAFQVQSEKPRSETGLALLGDLCQMPGVKWNYILKDESRRCFAGYLQCPFQREQCSAFFRQARDGTDWKRPRDMPRGTAWMVAKGCTCPYRYGGYEVEPQEFPSWMLDIMRAIMPFCGLSQPAEWPNSCNLNLYDTGGSSVAWHADDEALFNGKFQDIRIVSLSLGVRRTFELRANIQNQSKATERMSLGDGDLCTMEGMTQKHYQHRVPPEGTVEGPRINLTWRWTTRHTPMCPAGRQRPS